MKKRDFFLNTERHAPMRDAFCDLLNQVERREGLRPYEVVTRFLEASARAVAGSVLQGNRWQANEDEYMRIVGRMREPGATMEDFSKMLGEVSLALEAEPIDFLGPVFTATCADQWMGQFFTPHHISKLMAGMTMGDRDELLPLGRRYLLLHEPACGVGGMALAANVVLRERGIDPAVRAHWHMVDIDARAVHAAYLQMSLSAASAIVWHGNTLSGEAAWSSWVTPAAIAFPKRSHVNEGLKPDPSSTLIKTDLPEPPPVPDAPPAAPATKQLSLFGDD